MLKKYKNEVYSIIKDEFGLDVNKFIVTDFVERGNPITEIKVKDSDVRFHFYNGANSWEVFRYRVARYTPNPAISGLLPEGQSTTYFLALEKFREWLKNDATICIEEIDGANNWEGFQFEQNIFSLINGSTLNNQPFTKKETKYILDSVDNFRGLIIERFNPIESQLTFINEKLDYLTDATTRLGKFDWFNVFLSTIISIAINMTVDSETGKVLYELVKQAFSSFKFLIEK